jgi:predicted HAD superfamily Cof-like phosphohydrolase
MTNSIMEMVREFSEKTGQAPNVGLYADLINEEMGEWMREPSKSYGDLKELSDLVYVIYGYANAQGYDLDEAVRRVHQNNLDRVIQPDGTIKRREDGKILKRENPPKVVLEDLI